MKRQKRRSTIAKAGRAALAGTAALATAVGFTIAGGAPAQAAASPRCDFRADSVFTPAVSLAPVGVQAKVTGDLTDCYGDTAVQSASFTLNGEGTSGLIVHK